MKVVVVTTSFPERVDDAAGCFVLAEAEQVAAAGCEVHVLAPARRFRWRAERRGSLMVHPAGGGALFGWPGALPRLRRAPWRLGALPGFAAGVRLHLRQLPPPRRLVAHWLVPAAWPLLADLDDPMQIIAHGADIRLLGALPAPVRGSILRTLVERESSFRFVSAQGRDQLLASLPDPLAEQVRCRSTVSPLPLGLPAADVLADAVASGRDWLAHRTGGSAVVCMGRLVASKRYHLAVLAMAACERPPLLVMVGDGPERRSLAALARRLGIEIAWAGQLPRTRALGLLGAGRALLHPSASESAPTVVREARALGVPVVACEAGDLPRWAAQDRGIRLVAAAPRNLAEGIAWALQQVPSGRAPSTRADPGLRPGALRGHAAASVPRSRSPA